jgi:spore coat polysaccharide biosynthesis protein SpsF
MKIGAILQARCGSSRFSNKVLQKLPFHGKISVLKHIENRIAKSTKIQKFIVATTTEKEDDQIAELFPENIFRGDVNDVLSRYYLACKEHHLDIIVRFTGDNPCINAENIDRAIANHINNKYDYSHTYGLPLGTNIEVISFPAIELAYLNAKDTYETEHVTPYITRRPGEFQIGETLIDAPINLQRLRLTLDYPSDYAMLNLIFSYFGDTIFSLQDLGKFIDKNPWIIEVNPNHQKQDYKNSTEELKAAAKILKHAELNVAMKIVENAIKNE